MFTRTRCRIGFLVLFAIGIAGRAFADLDDQAYERFYTRYVGSWKVNVAKSRYLVGAPEERAFNYVAMPGRKSINYNGEAMQLLDGKDHPVNPARPSATVAREVLDEFTIVNVVKQNGKVTARNTFVVSPDGKSGAFILVDIDERGAASVKSLLYCEKQ